LKVKKTFKYCFYIIFLNLTLVNCFFIWRNPIEVLAPMAGITDGEFCSKMAKYGFDLLTIGGYNADQGAINAGLKIIKRGRPEFDVAEEELVKHITKVWYLLIFVRAHRIQ
jgi:tRNA-dihydrouridine synthase